eukprot:gene6247-8605_t
MLKQIQKSSLICYRRSQSICIGHRSLSFQSKSMRNVGVVAHIDAGKTTTTEQMLYICGETNHIGRVDTGDTIMDFLPQERERGITISAAAISFQWKNHLINLIDTPGHVDFTIEVERSARALDGSIVIIDAVSGVQAQTRTVWKQMKKQNIPAIAFVNKMDRDGACFERSVSSLKEKLSIKAIPIQYPIGSEDTFIGVIDLISMNKVIWPASSSSKPSGIVNIEKLLESDEYFDDASQSRSLMLEDIVGLDDEFMESYLEFIDNPEKSSQLLNNDTILNALRRICMTGVGVPTLCGASLRCKGVEPLLDSILAFLPNPSERPDLKAIQKSNPNKMKMISTKSDNLVAFSFKIVHDNARGSLVFVRVFAGTIFSKQTIYNSTQGCKERVNQILKVSADDFDNIPESGAGTVCCLVGLKNTNTGDTLVVDKGPLHDYILDGLSIPKSVYSLSIEPEKSSQQTELETALTILCKEDPSLQYFINKESGQTLLHGIGELHLEIVCDKLKRQFNLTVTTGDAYVAYRESLSYENCEKMIREYTYDKTTSIRRLYAHMKFEIHTIKDHNNKEATFHISSDVKLKLTNEEYVSLGESLKDSLSRGPLGYPLIGMHLIITDCIRDQDTTTGALRACASMFINSILRNKEDHVTLEPMMMMEIETPMKYVGDILSDMTINRRAHIKEVQSSDDTKNIITTLVPLATILGYASRFRSITQGEGNFTTEYHSHQIMDDFLVEEVVGKFHSSS